MTPINYFKNCYTNNFLNFNDRARREEYWYFTLFRVIITIILMLLTALSSLLYVNILMFIIPFLLFIVVSIIPSFAVTVRRLHDVGLSGWMYLITLIPFGGIFIFIKLIEDGNPYTNKYGNDPKGRGLNFEFETIHNQKI